MIDVSIIMPVYNTERYITRCIESVRMQNFINWELILINDGSSDHSGSICDKYAKLDNRIQVIHQHNQGVSQARNNGINLAKGKYITFIDSDDWIESNFLSLGMKAINDMKVDILITGFIFHENGINKNIFKKGKQELLTREKAKKELLLQEKFNWAVYDKFYKRELFKNIKFDIKYKIGEDMLFVWQIFNISEKIAYVPLYKYFYDISASSTMSSKFSLKWFDGIKVKKRIFKEIDVSYKELKLLSKIICIVEMTVLSKKAIIADNYNTKRLIKYLQMNIRKYFYFIFLYPNSNIITFKQRLGIIYFSLPYCICKTFSNYLSR